MKSFSSFSTEELVSYCCASNEIEAWDEFVLRFHRLIAKIIIRGASRYGFTSQEMIDDLIQETYLKLCIDNYRALRNFDHKHPDGFAGYVQVVAANVVRDHFKAYLSRKRDRSRNESLPEGESLAAPDSGIGSPKSIERSLLIKEVGECLSDCAPVADKDRNLRIFWLYYRVGLSAGAIAALPDIGLTTKGVESIIFRLTTAVRQRIGDRQGEAGSTIRAGDEGILPAGSF